MNVLRRTGYHVQRLQPIHSYESYSLCQKRRLACSCVLHQSHDAAIPHVAMIPKIASEWHDVLWAFWSHFQVLHGGSCCFCQFCFMQCFSGWEAPQWGADDEAEFWMQWDFSGRSQRNWVAGGAHLNWVLNRNCLTVYSVIHILLIAGRKWTGLRRHI